MTSSFLATRLVIDAIFQTHEVGIDLHSHVERKAIIHPEKHICFTINFGSSTPPIIGINSLGASSLPGELRATVLRLEVFLCIASTAFVKVVPLSDHTVYFDVTVKVAHISTVAA